MAPHDLTERAKAIIGSHYECEDSWYSCPLSEEGCANEHIDKTVCTCGYEARKRDVELLMQQTRQDALREVREKVSKLFDQGQCQQPDYYCALLDVGNAVDALARLASEGG